MNNHLELLKERRTIRRFQEKIIPADSLEMILQAAQSSQSWNNTQCWELVLIDDPEVRKHLQAAVPTKNPGYRAVVQSAILICVCAKTKVSGFFGSEPGSTLGDWYMHDIGIVTQNICTQAQALGLGTVVIGWLDHEKAKGIIGLPEGYELISLIPLGHPDQSPKPTSRKDLDDFIHLNKFGEHYSTSSLTV